MIYSKAAVTNLYEAGALIDMTDLIEQYGPNIPDAASPPPQPVSVPASSAPTASRAKIFFLFMFKSSFFL